MWNNDFQQDQFIFFIVTIIVETSILIEYLKLVLEITTGVIFLIVLTLLRYV